ncbi:hypothetical protein ABIB75_008064 [Bradyrhizobium sp. GM2.2]
MSDLETTARSRVVRDEVCESLSQGEIVDVRSSHRIHAAARDHFPA